MKIVVAVDSLKGSLTSIEAGNAVKTGIHRVLPDAEVIVKPLADGGEGTTDAFIEGMGAKRVDVFVTGPNGSKVRAYYGILEESDTAIMEMASAAGITLLPERERDPMTATTYGVGEMILHAIARGCRRFIIGIGGSATNDGGIGMLKALGYRFLDASGEEVGEGGQALGKVSEISADVRKSELADCSFQIACDVTNPLCGETGATYIYGPQKGVTDDTRDILEHGMQNYASVTSSYLGKDISAVPGVGAAGGLGFAFLGFLNAKLVPGIDLILDAVRLEQELANVDIVVTGEGRLDHQTAMGKAPVGVAALAKKHNILVIAFAGGVTAGAVACNQAGIDAYFPIVRGVSGLAEAMEPAQAKRNMEDSTEQVFRLIQAVKAAI